MTSTTGGPPQQIFIIRHGEKPPDDEDAPNPGPPFGVDFNGNQNPHSLTPRGWQRSGALAVLFDPAVGPIRPGLTVPNHLFCPSNNNKTITHRTYQTILGVSDRSHIKIDSHYALRDEKHLAKAVVHNSFGAVLICWEHHNIPTLAALLTTPDTTIPPTWPATRFDIIWCFTLSTTTDSPHYKFSQIPQLLLDGDSDKPISTTGSVK